MTKDDSYGLTPEGRREIDSVVHGVTYHHSFEVLEKWILKHPAPGEE